MNVDALDLYLANTMQLYGVPTFCIIHTCIYHISFLNILIILIWFSLGKILLFKDSAKCSPPLLL